MLGRFVKAMFSVTIAFLSINFVLFLVQPAGSASRVILVLAIVPLLVVAVVSGALIRTDWGPFEDDHPE